MPSYSLTLRQNKGRRLTISELDNNWLYLKELAELGGTSSDSSGDFPIREYGVSYVGYLVSDLSRIGMFELISGSFASGDTISGSSSGATADIIHILNDEGQQILFVNNISGEFITDGGENGEYINNQTQVGTGAFYLLDSNLNKGSVSITNLEYQEYFSPGNLVWATASESGISSLFITTTHSLSQYDLILQPRNEGQVGAIGIISVTESTITTTYSTGIESDDNLFGSGNKGTGIIIQDQNDGNTSFIGVLGIDIPQFVSDPMMPAILNFGDGKTNLNFFSNTGTYLSFMEGDSNNGSSIDMKLSSFCLSNLCGSNCSSFVLSCQGPMWEFNNGTDCISFVLSNQGPMWGFNNNNFILPKDAPISYGQPIVTLGCVGGCVELGWGPSHGTIDGLSIDQNTTVGICAA